MNERSMPVEAAGFGVREQIKGNVMMDTPINDILIANRSTGGENAHNARFGQSSHGIGEGEEAVGKHYGARYVVPELPSQSDRKVRCSDPALLANPIPDQRVVLDQCDGVACRC